jgi:rhodanese-related sulfurtransferase
MSRDEILYLGEYQLRNLLRNQIVFLYFDLRVSTVRASESPGHGIFQGTIPVSLDEIVASAGEKAFSKEHPIVLISENGETAISGAGLLVENGYRNVYVLRGGTASLDLSVP